MAIYYQCEEVRDTLTQKGRVTPRGDHPALGTCQLRTAEAVVNLERQRNARVARDEVIRRVRDVVRVRVGTYPTVAVAVDAIVSG